MEEVEEGMEVAMGVMAEEEEGMGTAKRREKLTPSLKLMLLLKPMPITVMEAMEADMVMVDIEDTAMGANGDQLNPATDMAATEEAMVVMEALVDMEGMVGMEVMVATDMVDMDIMVETDWTSNHTDRRNKELET